jgi:hypothetical protein
MIINKFIINKTTSTWAQIAKQPNILLEKMRKINFKKSDKNIPD